MRDSAQKSIQLFPSLHFSPCLLLPVGFEITTMHKNIKHKKENYPKNYYSCNKCITSYTKTYGLRGMMGYLLRRYYYMGDEG